MNIHDDICTLKGVGVKTKEILNKCGIYTLLDFILYFPRDYEKKTFLHDNFDINNLKENEIVIIKGKVIKINKDIYVKRNMIISEVVIDCNGYKFILKWFNSPYIKNKLNINREYILEGVLKKEGYKNILVNPSTLKKVEDINIISPKYSLKEKLTNTLCIKIISTILDNIKIEENLPEDILEKYKLCSLDDGIKNIHRPINEELLNKAIIRLKFQELFTYCMKILILKECNEKEGISFNISSELKELKDKLPFNLTDAQNKVIREILIDEKKNKPMNRLLQGDVGSGKTIVSLIVLFNVIKNGYQGALMVPTEILAYQHYKEAKELFLGFNINIEVLSGSISIKNKKIIKENLKNGEIDLIIGTHALIEEDVEFLKLGMVVTDEQHRFGVKQRSKLNKKDKNIDVLVMSATPIPRTLALSIYGDLDVSTIDKLPKGRQKIDTFSIDKINRKKAYEFALKEISKGSQVYIVCPLVEDREETDVSSVEKLYGELKEEYFKNIEVEILHGKLNSKLKDEIMERFKNNKVKVLISTTVIEVGVNVPNATVMIIESAERFGLSQLHQLRGRVGRGNKKSYCILISNLKSDTTKKRMDIIKESNDGFFIAEEDLKLRGIGEIFGVNQHGEDELVIADFIKDLNIFKCASYEARKIIKSDDPKDNIIKKEILKKLNETSKYISFN